MKRALLLAGVIAVAVTAGADAGGKAETRVTLDNIEFTPGGTIYTGDIFSSRKSCKNQRRVYVYRVVDGPDDLRGSTRSFKGESQPGYFWILERDEPPPPGGYYSKVRPTDNCKGDRSPLYIYP